MAYLHASVSILANNSLCISAATALPSG